MGLFFTEALLMMELPKRHATSLHGQPVRTHSKLGLPKLVGSFRCSVPMLPPCIWLAQPKSVEEVKLVWLAHTDVK